MALVTPGLWLWDFEKVQMFNAEEGCEVMQA
jgi:hypothetical protein